MHCIPPAIIYVNNDLSAQVQATLQTQLFITEAMAGSEFDARVAADPNYPHEVHINMLRILVIRSLSDFTNRHLADVVIFIKAGLASVESNKCGPPCQTSPVAYLTAEKLLKHFPPFCPSPLFNYCVQNNVLYPMHPFDRHPALFPFGSDKDSRQDTIFWTIPGEPFHAKGALIPVHPEFAPQLQEHHRDGYCR